jgi:hypothetical protein
VANNEHSLQVGHGSAPCRIRQTHHAEELRFVQRKLSFQQNYMRMNFTIFSYIFYYFKKVEIRRQMSIIFVLADEDLHEKMHVKIVKIR